MNKAIAYLRVSTLGQDTTPQKLAIENYATIHGLEIVEWIEEKVSGTGKKKRPLFDGILTRIRGGGLKGQTLIVAKLDRFARSVKQLFEGLEAMKEHGVMLVSVQDNIDMSTAQGQAMVGMLGVFAQFEASLIQDRTRAAYQSKKAQGMPVSMRPDGTPKLTSWGRKCNLTEEQKKYIEAQRKDGFGYRIIARGLGLPESAVMGHANKFPRAKKSAIGSN